MNRVLVDPDRAELADDQSAQRVGDIEQQILKPLLIGLFGATWACLGDWLVIFKSQIGDVLRKFHPQPAGLHRGVPPGSRTPWLGMLLVMFFASGFHAAEGAPPLEVDVGTRIQAEIVSRRSN